MNNTIGREYNTGKIAQVECISNDTLKSIDIKEQCYLLLILTAGTATFRVSEKEFTARERLHREVASPFGFVISRID